MERFVSNIMVTTGPACCQCRCEGRPRRHRMRGSGVDGSWVNASAGLRPQCSLGSLRPPTALKHHPHPTTTHAQHPYAANIQTIQPNAHSNIGGQHQTNHHMAPARWHGQRHIGMAIHRQVSTLHHHRRTQRLRPPNPSNQLAPCSEVQQHPRTSQTNAHYSPDTSTKPHRTTSPHLHPKRMQRPVSCQTHPLKHKPETPGVARPQIFHLPWVLGHPTHHQQHPSSIRSDPLSQ